MRDNMRRQRLSGEIRTAAVLLLAIVAFAALFTGVPVAATEDIAQTDDYVIRDGNTVQITLDGAFFSDNDDNITVRVEETGDTVDLQPSDRDGDTRSYEVGVSDLSSENTSLGNATVTVEASNGSVTESVDLRLIRFAEERASFSDGSLVIPLSDAYGYADGENVSVTIDRNTAVDGTARYTDRTALVVTLSPDQVELPPSENLDVTVPNGASTQVDIRRAAQDATDVSNGGQLLVYNPLLADGVDYQLTVRTDNGTLAQTVEAEADALIVTEPALRNVDSLTVSIHRDGDVLVENVERTVRSDPKDLTVSENGEIVIIADTDANASNATVWISNESTSILAETTITEGRIDLSGTPYRLHPNGSYEVIVNAGGQVIRANVSGNESDTLFWEGNNGGDFGGDSAGFLGFSLLHIFAIGGSVVLSGGVLLVLLFGLGGFGSDGRGTEESGPDRRGNARGVARTSNGREIEVNVVDGATGNYLQGQITITAKRIRKGTRNRQGGQREKEFTLSNGRGSIELKSGQWDLSARADGASETKRVVIRNDGEIVTLSFEATRVTATVSDENGTACAGIAVTCTSPQGRTDTIRTDDDGKADFDVPHEVRSVELTADHEKYESDATELSLSNGQTEASFTIQRRTGTLQLTATVDGTAAEGVPVGIVPRDESVREIEERSSERTTGTDGAATFEDLVVGRYEVRMAIPSNERAFSVQSKRVQIDDGRTTRETINATFEYSLDRDDRDRIASIRRAVESLASATGRDVAIPRYYGTVVTTLLEAVERVSQEGERFVTTDQNPQEIVTALLDTAEEAVKIVEGSMTTKRNTDLFGACVDMQDAQVGWQGDFDAGELFDLLEQDRTAQRQSILQRLRAVDDRIDAERSDLAMVAPARELWEEIQSMITAERGDDPVRSAAVVFVAAGLLDAIDELFEHDRLRSRLERTVF